MMFVIMILSLISASYSYDKSESILYDKFSGITHCTQQQITSWSCKLCHQISTFTAIQYIQNTVSSIVVFLGYLPESNKIIISWRGTIDIQNWVEDFTYDLISYPYCQECKVHTGFYLSYLSVSLLLQAKLDILISKYQSASILVTGSSLGGALATICGINLQNKYQRVNELHVFGSPRIGNINLAMFINKSIPKIYRVIHNRDIVPHVPFIQMNYHHIAEQILFDENMDKYIMCDMTGQDPNCSNSYNPNFNISDHTTYWTQPLHEDICTNEKQ